MLLLLLLHHLSIRAMVIVDVVGVLLNATAELLLVAVKCLIGVLCQ